MRFIILAVTTALWASHAKAEENYLVGAGKYDITGPVAESIMMGYVSPSQKTAGISTRLHARAFVIAEPGDVARVAIVNVDHCNMPQSVKDGVIKRLTATYGDLYTHDNVLLSATHTHSSPGGDSYYQLYRLSTLGFSQETLDLSVDGIYEAIVRAHDNLTLGHIKIASGDLLDASVNRSAIAYKENPAAERAQYPYDTDKLMTVLRLEQADGTEVGIIDWFAVHATSMQVTNHLISADNKGYAATLFERSKGSKPFAAKGFVAAFANSNAGDSSPALAAKDLNGDGDWDCPLIDSFKCNRSEGTKQFDKAKELYDGAKEAVAGPIDFRHKWIDFSNIPIELDIAAEPGQHHTCPGAIGLSMLAGAEDHRGIGKEGQACSKLTVFGRLFCLRDRDDCQGEKPIAIHTGDKNPPWTPQVLPLQIIRIGQLALAAVPGEFTTMSGRRVRKMVEDALASSGVTHVVLAGYANAYSGYVATREEYQLQQYEGASTHFGEWTLSAYQQEMRELANAMRDGRPVVSAAQPLDLSDEYRRPQARKLHPFDALPLFASFGDVVKDAKSRYTYSDVVSVSFWAAHPNNNPMIQSSYLEVQRETADGWIAVYNDDDEETKYMWDQPRRLQSLATVEWRITKDAPPGNYRILVRGEAIPQRFGSMIRYEGVSRTFEVR